MTDITKCANGECKHRDTCYRVKAKSSIMQSWHRFEPDEDGKCEWYLE